MIRKKSETFQRKSQHLLRHQKTNRLKQLGFTTSWAVTQQKRDYNALQDPHADRYFRYESVKMHMKQLKKSIAKSQKNEAQKKKIAKLIKQKLTDHLPAIKVAAQTYNIPSNQLNISKLSQKLNKQKSLTEIGKNGKKNKKKKNKHLNHNQTQISLNQMSEREPKTQQNRTSYHQMPTLQLAYTENNKTSQKYLDKKQTEKREYLKKQQQTLHRKKHQQFISFIAKKRQILQSANKMAKE